MLAKLENFELDLEDVFCRQLDALSLRTIKLYSKRAGACAAKVRRLSGGLSGAQVFRVTLLNEMGVGVQNAVCKIATFDTVCRERDNFNSHVVALGVGSFPTFLGDFFAGCGRMAGIFFQLAADYSRPLFVLDDAEASQAIETLSIYQLNWHNDQETTILSIRDIRRSQISDERFKGIQDELVGLQIEELEAISTRVKISVQHGDLHGGNVLVSFTSDPVIIDYGEIGKFVCSLDPIVLELSYYFHPDSRDKFERTDEIIDNWFCDDVCDLCDVVKNPQSVQILRAWSERNAFSGRERAAITYAYCVRQISYEGTDKDFAIKLIRKVIEFFGISRR